MKVVIENSLEPQRASTRQREKCIIAISVLIFNGLLIWQLSLCILKYISCPLSTSVHIRRPHTYQVPPFTICPKAIFEKIQSSAGGTFSKINYQNHFMRNLDKITNEKCGKSAECSTNKDYALYPLKKLNISLANLWNTLAVDVKKFIVHEQCAFAINKTACNESRLFNTGIITELAKRPTFCGLCTTIKPINEFHVVPCKTNSWEIEVPNTPITNFTLNFLHMIESPQHDSMWLGIDLTKNKSWTAIDIVGTRTFKNQNTRKNPCLSLQEFQDCRNKCIDDKMKKLSICRLPFLEFQEHPACENLQQTLLSLSKTYQWYLDLEYLRCNCARKCDDTIYALEVEEGEASNLSSHSVKFVYVSSVIEVITENYSYTFSTMMSEIAGNVGFFVGVSLLSLVQLSLNIYKKLKNKVRVNHTIA